MADPNQNFNGTISELQEQLDATDTIESVAGLGDAAKTAADKFAMFEEKVLGTGQTLDKMETITSDQAKNFGLLTTAVFGSSEMFKDFGGHVQTIGGRLDDFTKRVGTGTGAVAALIKAGASSDLAKEMAGTINVVKKLGQGFIESADNVLKLRAGYMSLAASTGDLGDVYASAGNKLENINEVISNQAMIMANAAGATNMPLAEMEKYYMQLGKIPGALNAVVQGGTTAAGNMDMLTAATRVAHGTGRDMKDIMADLATAATDYGLRGEPALKFTARFTEISSKFHTQLSEIKKALASSAAEFSKYANAGDAAARMAEGSAMIMNNYMKAFQDTGITGEKAASIIGTMTNQVGELNIAQKAFLSAQTGGPGGLMGGFQIEKMLREGDVAGVFEKAKQTMQKQFGSIVTLDEASKSEAAAAQFQKQISILRSGPLGTFAKTDQDAMRILEGFKGGAAAPPPTQLKDTVLQDTMNKGLEYEKQTATAVTKSANILEKSQLLSGFTNLKILQGTITAGAGNRMVDTEEIAASRELISSGMLANQKTAGKIAGKVATQLGSKQMTGVVEESILKTAKDFKAYVQDLPVVFTSIKELGASIFSKQANPEEIRKKQAEAAIQYKAERAQLVKGGAGAAKIEAFDEKWQTINTKANETLLKIESKKKPDTAPATGITGAILPVAGFEEKIVKEGTATPGKAPGATMAVAAANATATKPGAAPTAAKESQAPTLIEVKTKVEGFCLKCQEPVDEKHLHAVSSATKQKQ